MATQQMAPTPARKTDGGLYHILELILDRGLVIDAFVRVSLVGIEILRIDIRVVVASVDTYLRFAEACNRLDLENKGGATLPDLVGDTTEKIGHGKTKGALSGAIESIADSFSRGGEDDDQDKEQAAETRPRRSSSRSRRTEEQ
jgi:hypothetical protein